MSTNLDGTVTLWDAESADGPRETLRGHSGSVRQAVFSPDGATLYTASHDGTAIAWDLAGTAASSARSRSRSDRDVRHAYDTHPGRFSPDGRLIAVGLKGEGLALLDARTLDAGRGAAARTRTARSWRSPSPRTGERSRPRPANGSRDGLGRRIAVAAPWAALRGRRRLEHRGRRLRRGRNDARDGRQRRRRRSGTSPPASGSAASKASADPTATSPSARTASLVASAQQRRRGRTVWDVAKRSRQSPR